MAGCCKKVALRVERSHHIHYVSLHGLLALFSIGYIVLGSFYLIKFNQHADYTGNALSTVASVIIGAGAAALVVRFVLFVFWLCDRFPLVVAALVVLVFIGLLRLATGIAGYVVRHDMQSTVAQTVNATMKQNGSSDSLAPLQQALLCCGSIGPLSWNKTVFPGSCCPTPSSQWLPAAAGCGGTNSSSGSDPFTKGCVEVLQDWVKYEGAVFSGIVISMVVVEALCSLSIIVYYCKNN